LLDLHTLGLVSEYFVICSGLSDRNLDALIKSVVEDTQAKYKLKPKLEGRPAEGWLLADYGSVVVHIFSHDQRDYYRLEDLWSTGKVLLHVQ
jgi:ribosome-associated protein